MRFHLATFSALVALASLTGCGSDKAGATGDDTNPTPTPASTEGELDVDWAFSGVEAPTKVRVLVIDGDTSGYTCSTLPFNMTAGIVENKANLPVSGNAVFNDVSEGTKYLVVGVGEKSNGARVALDCHDQVNVVGGETTSVTLGLKNVVADMNGVYGVSHEINMGLPNQITTALLGLQAVCGVLNAPELCNIVTEVNSIVTDLDVTGEWTIDQTSPSQFAGEVEWLTIEGQDIGTYEILNGSFVGEVPGATQMAYKDFNLELHVGNLTLFILEEVINLDLGDYGVYGAIVVNALGDNYVSPLTFSGAGTLNDLSPVDGVTEKIDGGLVGHLQIGSFGHDFAVDYLATRP
jgi:hypothetical protein